MKDYTVTFDYQEGDFEITVETNFKFKNNSHEKALAVTKTRYQNIDKYIKPYFDKKKNKVVIDILENDYYDSAFVSNYKFYDSTKGDSLRLNFEDGTSFYPVANPNCYVELREDEFINLINEHYEEYLEGKEILSFGSISYSVKEAHVDTLVLD